MEKGRTCIVADSRHTKRWKDTSPVLGRGGIGFLCNDNAIAHELQEWSRQNDRGNPRSTDDLQEVEFADVLARIAEAHHLDRCVNAAFVGTQEAKEEAEQDTIDGIYGPDDEAAIEADQDEHIDEEQDLLEKIP